MYEPIIIRDYLGRSVTGQDLEQAEIQLFHASNEEKKLGDVWDSSDYLSRRHYEYFFKTPARRHPDPNYQADRRVIEGIFEEVRLSEVNTCMSRQEAIFAACSLRDTLFWAQFQYRNRFIYELRLSGECFINSLFWFEWSVRKQKGVICDNLFTNVPTRQQIEMAARSYWDGEPNPNGTLSSYEALLKGRAQIIGRYNGLGQPIP